MSGLTLRPSLQFSLALILLLAAGTVLHAQKPVPTPSQGSGTYTPPQPVAVKVSVRDMRGNPLD
ncbi:MAG TPA: hypothetical protein VK814_00015, partial [Acidobacteriaceae bacterium]|nr:hypothetical protein [Acidobacteriaceae bacterium]